jgi:hypothetical protein
MERLHPKGKDHLLYHCPKPQPGGKQGDLVLTPLELIDKLAALVPPPRTHRHRYFGVLAPNSPLRGAVTALALHPEAVPLFTGRPGILGRHTRNGQALTRTLSMGSTHRPYL